jgi:hypothetical protein
MALSREILPLGYRTWNGKDIPPTLGRWPRENEIPADTLKGMAKAKAAIIEGSQDSETNSHILLGAFALNLISIRNKDMVNVVYSTQGEKPLTFKQASDCITRLIGA